MNYTDVLVDIFTGDQLGGLEYGMTDNDPLLYEFWTYFHNNKQNEEDTLEMTEMGYNLEFVSVNKDIEWIKKNMTRTIDQLSVRIKAKGHHLITVIRFRDRAIEWLNDITSPPRVNNIQFCYGVSYNKCESDKEPEGMMVAVESRMVNGKREAVVMVMKEGVRMIVVDEFTGDLFHDMDLEQFPEGLEDRFLEIEEAS